MDLGCKLSRKLGLGLRIQMVCCKALESPRHNNEAIKRFEAYFLSFILLFDSAHSGIWCYFMGSPYRQECLPLTRLSGYNIGKFLRFASYFLGINCTPHNYSSVTTQLGLTSLADQMRTMAAYFLKELLTSRVDSTTLQSCLNFKVPHNIPLVSQ